MAALDVDIRWGTSVLHVARLAPPRSVYVGESGPSCDCLIPAALLGQRRAPLITVDPDGTTWLAVLPGATGSIDIAGQPETSLRAAIEEGRARPHLVPLPPGARARVELGGVVFDVVHDPAGPAVERHVLIDQGAPFHLGVSLVAHAFVFLASAFAMPPLLDTSAIDEWWASPYIVSVPLCNVSEKEPDEPLLSPVERSDPDDRAVVESRCADDIGGSMGVASAGNTRFRYGVEGPPDNPDPHLAKYARPPFWHQVIGSHELYFAANWRAPLARWGRDHSLGNDPESARGNMWGDHAGDAFGSPGAGIGREDICDHCGGYARGRRVDRTAAGDATPTESTLDLR